MLRKVVKTRTAESFRFCPYLSLFPRANYAIWPLVTASWRHALIWIRFYITFQQLYFQGVNRDCFDLWQQSIILSLNKLRLRV